MDYPPAVVGKAQRSEHLLHRVATGEPLDETRAGVWRISRTHTPLLAVTRNANLRNHGQTSGADSA